MARPSKNKQTNPATASTDAATEANTPTVPDALIPQEALSPAEADAVVDEPASVEQETLPILPVAESSKKVEKSFSEQAPPQTLREKLLDLSPQLSPQAVQRALHVHSVGGTVAIMRDKTLLILPSLSPDRGGKERASRGREVRAFLSDL